MDEHVDGLIEYLIFVLLLKLREPYWLKDILRDNVIMVATLIVDGREIGPMIY